MTPWDQEPWRVQVDPVGNKFHLYPARGLMQMGNWRAPLPMASEYARSARALKRRIRQCQRVCDQENAREARAAEILDECTRKP